MTIITKEKVIEAYKRALELGGGAEEAIAAVAHALALPVETVAECVAEVQAC